VFRKNKLTYFFHRPGSIMLFSSFFFVVASSLLLFLGNVAGQEPPFDGTISLYPSFTDYRKAVINIEGDKYAFLVSENNRVCLMCTFGCSFDFVSIDMGSHILHLSPRTTVVQLPDHNE